jgi:hypothetical protein
MAFFEFFTSETNVQPVNPEYNMADFNKISVDWFMGKSTVNLVFLYHEIS